MKIYLISKDSFLAQEFLLAIASNSYNIEVHEDGLIALEDMRHSIPASIFVDNDCDGLNPLILLKLISRDSRFENSKIFFLSKDEIDNKPDFIKEYGIFKVLNKPISNEKFLDLVL